MHPFESRLAEASPPAKGRRKGKKDKDGSDGADDGSSSKKRRCISSACVPCRRRKSKCDGTTPACSACAAVYNTPCVYDPNSDHRRKGVYKKDIDNLKTRNSTLQTLVHAILNYPDPDVAALVQQIRTCESLDAVAESIIAREHGDAHDGDGDDDDDDDEHVSPPTSPAMQAAPTFESQLSGKMGELRLEDGSTRYIGGTSHLIHLGGNSDGTSSPASFSNADHYQPPEDAYTSWTTVTKDPDLVRHLINMYFCWHYSFFTTLSKSLFWREFEQGRPPPGSRRKSEYCTPLLVNSMLALGCHFTSWPSARAVRDNSATAGDHFFKEAKRLILEDDLHEVPALTTVQALALMSVREAGCGREAKGWVYSGMSFRMACDLGLNLDSGGMHSNKNSIDETEEDARRITFWGCFLFDKCWSNYLGRLPQLPNTIVTVPKVEVFPVEDADIWSAYTDSGFSQAHAQPSRTRAVARQISKLCEISSDLMNFFYNPIDMDKAKGKQAELKKLSEIHQRMETWKRELPKELEPKEGGLPSMLVMHMFFHLLYIHLFRPFLKYTQNTSPLPANVSPRKQCTQAAATISKLLRLYKRSHGLRQICNIAVYIAHSACTIHLLNLPEKNAKRDIIHGVKHLEEIAEAWLCARRTLGILSILTKRWKVSLPEEAATVLARTDAKFGPWSEAKTAVRDPPDPMLTEQQVPPPTSSSQTSPVLQPYSMSLANTATQFFDHQGNPISSSTLHRASEPRSLPPNDANPLAYPRIQRHPTPPTQTPSTALNPSTPASTLGRQSIDTPTSASNSPSQLFGGVEALIREGQDWWMRDQNQLAVGFDNWHFGADDVAGWFAGSAGMGSPGFLGGGSGSAGGVGNGGSGGVGLEGGAVGGAGVNGSGGGNGAVANGLNGFGGFGGALNTYNEHEWYQ
ncbi:fungal-specific transcription factor domain-containing protein [Massariosphaeria phaeospora]|uniref:Fungal-specific transcription factor domain-containing protein n=1 Tax=Massariosphaeria phaeospora TaxID=100035 RepID=A0A7C8I938_9PLEO|nr:fungal-specific transcription factor domain-containing protein [Massariosphaeria phaeospora]